MLALNKLIWKTHVLNKHLQFIHVWILQNPTPIYLKVIWDPSLKTFPRHATTWRIIPGSKWLIVSPLSGVVGPLPNGRTSWLINGADPNYLQVLGWSSKYSHKAIGCPRGNTSTTATFVTSWRLTWSPTGLGTSEVVERWYQVRRVGSALVLRICQHNPKGTYPNRPKSPTCLSRSCGFKQLFIFTPIPGEMIHSTHILFKWVETTN